MSLGWIAKEAVLPNMLCPQHRPDPSDDISSNFTNVCLAPIPRYLRLQP